MEKSIPLESLSIFKKLIKSFLENSEELKPYLEDYFSFSTLEKSVENKFLSPNVRNTLSSILTTQYDGLKINQKVRDNISLLRDSRTFTVTTGHQLNILSGPLYVLIKICQTIALSSDLNKKFPGYNFVPIYWLATEDHDIEEINHVNLFGKKLDWLTEQKGASGELSTQDLSSLVKEIKDFFKNSEENRTVLDEIDTIYKESNSLANAHRKLIHFLIPDSSLVILDPSSKELKSLFTDHIINELENQVCFKQISKTASEFKKLGFHVQIKPREICLFYLNTGYRERIEKIDSGFQTADGEYNWSEKEIHAEVLESPEKFSPNACFRPVYQEFILPNLVTLGGPGEISYWLELKGVFTEFEVDFPALILRNSHVFLSIKESLLMKDYNLSVKDLFDQKEKVLSLANGKNLDIDWDKYKGTIDDLIINLKSELNTLGLDVNSSVDVFSKNVQKQFGALNSKILKTSKSKNEVSLRKLSKVLDSVYPNQVLKERKMNFLELLNHYSISDLINVLTNIDSSNNSQLIVHIY